MAITLEGKSAIITGAGRGIGRGVAQVFAREGANVLVVNRSPTAGESVVAEIIAEGHEASYFQADVKSWEDMQGMAQTCIERYGGINIFCANAGIFPIGLIADLDENAWDDVMDTNLKGVFFGTKACIPQMRAQGGGRIVVVSSITGPNVGWPGLSHYMASKGGVNAYIKGLALELAADKITVNAVSPGTIMTDGLLEAGGEVLEEMRKSIPAGYIGAPEDIAYALMYFASEQARFVTGQSLVLDGGQILPESPMVMRDAN